MIPLKDENPTRTISFFTVIIILTNIFVFYKELTSEDMETFIFQHGLIPINFISDIMHLKLENSLFDLFSSMFMHGGLFHIISNMWFFWIFGNNVEDAMGHLRFLLFYLLCGIGAGLSQIFMNIHSTIPMVGASGAISGVIGAYFLLYPGARILTLVFFFYFIRLVYIPAGIFILFWFIMQVVSSVTIGSESGGVAWYAHIGGFLTGVMLTPILVKRKRRYRNFFT